VPPYPNQHGRAQLTGTPNSGSGSCAAAGAGANGTPHGWPRTWAASSDWSARVGTTSLTDSARRTAYAAGPVFDAHEGAAASCSPLAAALSARLRASSGAAAAAASGGASGAGGVVSPLGAAARHRLRLASSAATGELDETLMYDFDESLEAADHEEERRLRSSEASGGARQQQQQQQQHPHHQPRWSGESGSSSTFRFNSRRSGDLDWDSDPFAAVRGQAFSPPIKAGHSYLVARRELSGPGSALLPPAPAAAGPGPAAAPEGGFREPFVVHVEQVTLRWGGGWGGRRVLHARVAACQRRPLLAARGGPVWCALAATAPLHDGDRASLNGKRRLRPG
jgi:hypothetical protein